MPIKCYICKSWNCEDNGYDVMCYRIIEKDLMNKGLPQDIAHQIAKTNKYEEEEEYDEVYEIKEYSKCVECDIDIPKGYYHWCNKCYVNWCNYKTSKKPVGICLFEDDDE